MLTAKQLLLTQLAQAMQGRPDMPLLAAIAGVTDDEAQWRPPERPGHDPAPSIDQIVRHIAWSKARFCQQAFGTPMPLDDDGVSPEGDTEGIPWEMPCGCAWGVRQRPGIGGAVELLRAAHAVMTARLEELDDAVLEEPLPVHHGKTAANFFWTMVMHDLYHAGQIRTRRTMHALLA